MNSFMSPKLILLSILLVFYVFGIALSTEHKCILSQKAHKIEDELLKRIEPLNGKILTAIEYDEKGMEKFEYKVGICANPDPALPFSGVIQYEYAKKSNNFTLGRFNQTEIINGTNWILLTYSGGDHYMNVCRNASRMANIMIHCDPENKGEGLRIIGETIIQETPHCFYWFEFGSNLVCKQKEDKLSGGSIFCILTFTGFGFYLIFGFFYRRFVVGAQGLEQIPNYTFWKDFGNLQADGCDFVCRCGGRREQNAYRGINENMPRTEDRDRDDQLLTM